MIAKFNSISKILLFIITITIALTNAALFYLFSQTQHLPLLQLMCFILWANYMAGSIYLLKTAANVSKKSKIMYLAFQRTPELLTQT